MWTGKFVIEKGTKFMLENKMDKRWDPEINRRHDLKIPNTGSVGGAFQCG